VPRRSRGGRPTRSQAMQRGKCLAST
jgi:hypothetical protein